MDVRLAVTESACTSLLARSYWSAMVGEGRRCGLLVGATRRCHQSYHRALASGLVVLCLAIHQNKLSCNTMRLFDGLSSPLNYNVTGLKETVIILLRRSRHLLLLTSENRHLNLSLSLILSSETRRRVRQSPIFSSISRSGR